MNHLLLFVTLFLPSLSYAAEPLKGPAPLSLMTLFASLLLVIACIFVFAWLMKKSNLVTLNKQQAQIKVIARQALTNKGQVHIVEVQGKRYMLGVTEQNITLLDTLPALTDEELAAQPESAVTTPFATILSKMSSKPNE